VNHPASLANAAEGGICRGQLWRSRTDDFWCTADYHYLASHWDKDNFECVQLVEINKYRQLGLELNNKGRTPLDWADYSRHKDLVELLIRHGGETRTPWSGSPIGKWL